MAIGLLGNGWRVSRRLAVVAQLAVAACLATQMASAQTDDALYGDSSEEIEWLQKLHQLIDSLSRLRIVWRSLLYVIHSGRFVPRMNGDVANGKIVYAGMGLNLTEMAHEPGDRRGAGK